MRLRICLPTPISHGRAGVSLQSGTNSHNFPTNGPPNSTGTVPPHVEATMVRSAPANVRCDRTYLAGHSTLQATAPGYSTKRMARAAFGWMALCRSRHRPVPRTPASNLRQRFPSPAYPDTWHQALLLRHGQLLSHACLALGGGAGPKCYCNAQLSTQGLTTKRHARAPHGSDCLIRLPSPHCGHSSHHIRTASDMDHSLANALP